MYIRIYSIDVKNFFKRENPHPIGIWSKGYIGKWNCGCGEYICIYKIDA
jgi:hypothetical protein